MAELINLRTERKRAKRHADFRAANNRLALGQRKSERALEIAKHEKARQDLDRHQIDK